jgi:calcineurin-like phosphoesterase family protein
MNNFFISDTHFFHKNILKYSNRPFANVEEMNEKMIENWNKMVTSKDTVYHLGDVSFGPYQETKTLLRRLNGNIHIVWGNHDKTLQTNVADLIKSQIIRSAQHYLEISIDRQMIVLFHFGQRVWNKSHYSSIHLYGHSHGSLPPHGKSVDVGVDCKEITSEYRPVSIDEVKEYMSKRTFEAVDHHGD